LFKKEIYIDNEINFAAEVSSVFHLLCALSFAYRESKNKCVKGIVFIREHFITNEPMKAQVIELGNMKIDLISYKDKYKYLNIINKDAKDADNKNDIFYLLSVKVPNLDMYMKFKKSTGKKICAVLIDEGTGTYYNFSGALYPLKTLMKKFIIKMYFSNTVSYFFLKRNGKKLIPNEEAIKDMVEFIDRYNEVYTIENTNQYINSGERYAIMISGLFVEMGLISLEEYIKKLNTLNSIFNEKGIKLLIKPYQSEDLTKYDGLDFAFLPWDVTCELLFPIIKPILTLGFFSTSMITGKVFYGIESIDMSNIFELNKDTVYSKKYNKYFGLFKDFMQRADTFENLDKVLEVILNKSEKLVKYSI
jgi:hypothetical protein